MTDEPTRPDHYDERYDGPPEDVPEPTLADRIEPHIGLATRPSDAELREVVEALRDMQAHLLVVDPFGPYGDGTGVPISETE